VHTPHRHKSEEEEVLEEVLEEGRKRKRKEYGRELLSTHSAWLRM